MKNLYKTALVAMTLLSAPAMADKTGVSFEHKDWELACDNTLTCRAAGYAKEEGEGGSVLLSRDAGPDIAPTGEVILADTDADKAAPVTKLTLWINGRAVGDLAAVKDEAWQLSASQTQAVIRAVKGSAKVEFRGGAAPFILSGEGASAVMLKMDEVQGRIGTPGALTKKGYKPESSVLPAVPAPVIQAASVSKSPTRPLTAAETALFKPKMRVTLKGNDYCDRQQPSDERKDDAEDDRLSMTPLDDSHVLVSALCWRAAYNEGYGYWVTDTKLSEPPVLVTDSGSEYDKGVITMAQKGRGIGDCWSSASWVWDGKAFRQSHIATTGMCRYIRGGGTWDLPTLVTEVKAAR